jgi:hypothetical protein
VYLGVRAIRSAGRSSGSIEITLPAQLQVLEGIDCRLSVRDGSQPEIVLQPDLSAPYRLIKDLWSKLRLGLGDAGDIGEFAASDFTLVLFPPDHWQGRPPLVYADALKVLIRQAAQPESLTALVAALALVAAGRLELDGSLGTAFADALTYLATGTPTGFGADFERGMAHQALACAPDIRQAMRSALDDETWLALRPVARQVYQQFRDWQLNPLAYAAARENWYRAFTAQVAMGMPPDFVPVEHAGRLAAGRLH